MGHTYAFEVGGTTGTVPFAGMAIPWHRISMDRNPSPKNSIGLSVRMAFSKAVAFAKPVTVKLTVWSGRWRTVLSKATAGHQ